MLTASHCVHQGGGFGDRPKERGWIKSGTYTPAFRDGRTPHGSATASHLLAASSWYNAGELDAGYDAALVVLNKRRHQARDRRRLGLVRLLPHHNCLQPHSHLSQIGYPANYYGGDQMTQGEHHERSNSRDFLLGSGTRGGSSGGLHVANLGEIVDSSRERASSRPATGSSR